MSLPPANPFPRPLTVAQPGLYERTVSRPAADLTRFAFARPCARHDTKSVSGSVQFKDLAGFIPGDELARVHLFAPGASGAGSNGGGGGACLVIVCFKAGGLDNISLDYVLPAGNSGFDATVLIAGQKFSAQAATGANGGAEGTEGNFVGTDDVVMSAVLFPGGTAVVNGGGASAGSCWGVGQPGAAHNLGGAGAAVGRAGAGTEAPSAYDQGVTNTRGGYGVNSTGGLNGNPGGTGVTATQSWSEPGGGGGGGQASGSDGGPGGYGAGGGGGSASGSRNGANGGNHAGGSTCNGAGTTAGNGGLGGGGGGAANGGNGTPGTGGAALLVVDLP